VRVRPAAVKQRHLMASLERGLHHVPPEEHGSAENEQLQV
jgi:hypothetical protein